MNRNKSIVTMALGAALVVAASFTVLGFVSPSTAAAHAGFGGGWQGHRSHRHHGGGDPCARLTQHPIKIAELLVESHLDLDDAQVVQLRPMLDVVDRLRGDLAQTCEAAVAADDVDPALAALESALARSAEAVAELRPAYQTFYASLNDEQRAHIDDAVARHHARHQSHAE